MRWMAFVLGLTLVLNLFACSGSSGTIPLPARTNAPGTPSSARFTILVPNIAPPTAAKRRAFVSPSANGALVAVYAHSDTNHTTPLASVVANISAGSSLCTAGASGRNCVIAIGAPAGDDDFVFNLYDTAPVNGAIPATAHELGVAGMTATITAGAVNNLTMGISAIIAGFGGSTTAVAEAADGRTHNVALVIAPTDFGNNPITAGSANAPYANPITASISESGGTGHVLLELNGGAPAASVQITKATDTVQAVYDGGGTAGYTATVSLTASAVSGAGGATQENATIAPALFVNNPTVFYSPSPAQLNTYPQGQHVLMISEPGASSGTTYTAVPTGCSNILSVGTVVGTGAAATLLVVGGTQTSAGGCSVAISDGTLTFMVGVTNATRSGPGASPTIHEYTTTTDVPEGIVTGADGNLWYVQDGSTIGYGSINAIATAQEPNGSAAVVGHATTAMSGGFVEPRQATLGPDGNVWWGDCSQSLVAKVTTSGTQTTYPTTYGETQGVTPGLDGKTWFAEGLAGVVNIATTGNGSIGNINPTSGALTEITVPNPNSGSHVETQGMALGPDGNIWYDDFCESLVGHVVSGVATNFSTAVPSGASPLTAGADGNMWVGSASGIITVFTPAGAVQQSIDVGASYPGANQRFMIAGPDGAVWFTDSNNGAIGRVTTSGTVVEYSIPTSGSAPSGIAVGPDGNIWFAESVTDKIGELIL